MAKIHGEKKSSTSCYLSQRVRAQLDKMQRPSGFIASAVTKALGRCPVCDGKWPKRQAAHA